MATADAPTPPVDLTGLERRYLEANPRSHELFRRASERVPGGVHGNIKYFPPYPLNFASANGAWLTDVDGHRCVDYLLAFGTLVLGHGHPAVRAAVSQALQEAGTTVFGVPTASELELAERLAALYPACEQVRFTNSGLEATLLALRLGMAYTGRSHVAKFVGHYHGGHDRVLVSVHPPIAAGAAPVRDSMGLPDYYLDHTVVLPFNDLPACEEMLREHRDQVGVVIVEPMAAGFIAADMAFMRGLRDMTAKWGMVLVFDEVKTAFRVGPGGAQEHYGLPADLTAFGKILGGGFPIGAVGGRRDIMQLCSPLRSTRPDEVVFHSGTFNGNPMSVWAGLATLTVLQEAGVFPHLVEMTGALRRGIEDRGRRAGFTVQTVGVGAVFDVLFTGEPVRDYASYERASKDLRRALDFLLMANGVFSKPQNRFSLSIAHGDREYEHTMSAFEGAFSELRKLAGGA